MTTALDAPVADVAEVEPAHVMKIANGNGDTKLVWDIDNEDQVAAAEAMFDELVNVKKYRAYSVDRKGEKAEIIREFDKNAEAMILAPQTVGG